MNTFAIREFNVHADNLCNFYTVVLLDGQDEEVSETDKFYDRFFDEKSPYYDDMQDIHALIEELGEKGTAVIRRARDEARAYALPPELVYKECQIDIFGNKLRLYYVEMARNVLILLGGGIAHDDGKGKPPIQFGEAQLFAKKIMEANNVFFAVQEGRLISLDGEEIIIN